MRSYIERNELVAHRKVRKRRYTTRDSAHTSVIPTTRNKLIAWLCNVKENRGRFPRRPDGRHHHHALVISQRSFSKARSIVPPAYKYSALSTRYLPIIIRRLCCPSITPSPSEHPTVFSPRRYEQLSLCVIIRSAGRPGDESD